jgi:peptidoglycan/xylan/chitin deacetylase (PgdA/CDA1 family)
VAAVAVKAFVRSGAGWVGIRRTHVATTRMWVERNVLAARSAVQSERNNSQARILCYHSTGTPAWGVNDVRLADFRRHIETALALGYRFVSAEEIARGHGRAGDLAITFDDGLSSVVANAAPILREFGIHWTLFVVSAWADGAHDFGPDVFLDWQAIESLARDGVTIGSHSVTHRNFRHLSTMEAEDELFESRRAIEVHTGVPADAFAIPFGQSRDWSVEAGAAAHVAGYRVVYAQSEQRRPPGTVPRTFVTRFDHDRVFRAALRGAFDSWEEWA